LLPGRVIYSAKLVHAAVVETSFDDLVAEQREHATAQEQRSRIAVPIDARRATLIVDLFIRLRAELTDFTALLMAEAHAHEAAIIVAGRPDLAAGLGAHGVQLRANDLSPADARRVLQTGWIGRSVHSAVEGAEAVLAGADYLVAGSIWETPTHPDRTPAGIGLIEALVSLGKPVFAIGGVTAERARLVHAAGGWGVAAIRALWGARHPGDAAAAMVEAWA